jgi:hypothetical protein
MDVKGRRVGEGERNKLLQMKLINCEAQNYQEMAQ